MARRAQAIAGAYHAEAELDYLRRYPASINAAPAAALALEAAQSIVGAEAVATDLPPSMAAEDFAFMLNDRPGAYIWIGNGPARAGATCTAPTTSSMTRSCRWARSISARPPRGR